MSTALSTLLPFLILSLPLLLVNQSERSRVAQPDAGIDLAGILAYGMTALMMLLLFFAGIRAQGFGLVLRSGAGQELLQNPAASILIF